MSFNNVNDGVNQQQQQHSGGQQPWHQQAPGTHQPQPVVYDPAVKPTANLAATPAAPPQQPQHQPYYPISTAANNTNPGTFNYQQPPYQQQPYQPQQQQRPPGMNQYGFMRTPDFQHDLFGCFDNFNVCCEAYWCGYCQVASQYNKVENNIADIDWAVCAGMGALDYCCGGSGLALCIGTLIVRGKIRSRYNINPGGHECEDCCIVTWCMCCAIAQQHREMTSLGQYPGGIFTAPPPLAPRQQPQMGVPVVGSPVYHQNQQPPQQQQGGDGKQL